MLPPVAIRESPPVLSSVSPITQPLHGFPQSPGRQYGRDLRFGPGAALLELLILCREHRVIILILCDVVRE